MQDHYEVLNIRRRASQSEIKAAYRSLAREWHPDVSEQENSAEQFRLITEAYETLSHPERKEHYDVALNYTETIERQKREREDAQQGNPFDTEFITEGQEEKSENRGPGPDLLKLTSLLRQGRPKDAAALAEEILKTSPKEPLAHAVLADVARMKGDYKEAAQRYGFAAQYDPANLSYAHKQMEMAEAIETGPGREAVKEHHETSGTSSSPWWICGLLGLASAGFAPWVGEPVVGEITPGLIGSAVLMGFLVGTCLSATESLERFGASQGTALVRVSPVTLMTLLSLLSFWFALALYAFIGSVQHAFQASLSKVFAGVVLAVIVASLGAWTRSDAAGLQTLVWTGNLAMPAAIFGWMTADAFRQPNG